MIIHHVLTLLMMVLTQPMAQRLFQVVFHDDYNRMEEEEEANAARVTWSAVTAPTPELSQDLFVHLDRFEETYSELFPIRRANVFNRDTFQRKTDDIYNRFGIPQSYRDSLIQLPCQQWLLIIPAVWKNTTFSKEKMESTFQCKIKTSIGKRFQGTTLR